MGQRVKQRLALAVSLTVVAALALTWSISANRNRSLPDAFAAPGSDPVYRAADDPDPNRASSKNPN